MTAGTPFAQPANFPARLWRRDPTLFAADAARHQAIVNRLGWLDAPAASVKQSAACAAFARELDGQGIREVALLGMGGSSLFPLVLTGLFPSAPGFPALRVVDTTSPGTAAGLLAVLDPSRTLFLVASKSGTTIEPMVLSEIFGDFSGRVPGGPARFAAITDPGSPLAAQASREGYAALFEAPADVGGRFSALTSFGMVPAALLGVDVGELLRRARAMADACGPSRPPGNNPGLDLGLWMASQVGAGRDKLTILPTASWGRFALWLEQLLAESSGKEGTGIIPVAGEPWGLWSTSGADRCFVRIIGAGEGADSPDPVAEGVAADRVMEIRVASPLEIGAEAFRWEVATAALGCFLGINPFDEPNVGESKANTLRVLDAREPAPAVTGAAAARRLLDTLLAGAAPGEYVAMLLYLPYSQSTDGAVLRLRRAVAARSGLATVAGYGPRYLHSTGQIHKGGPSTGRFVIVSAAEEPVPIPGRPYTLNDLHLAQARGDELALAGRGRPVVRLHLASPGVLGEIAG